MTEYKRSPRNLPRMWFVGVIGLAYTALFAYNPAWLGQPLLAGSEGVLLGLYICSLPAANAIDYFFQSRTGHIREATRQTGPVWLATNIAVMLIGLGVIIIGATRFTAPATK
jgi:hypothetical protein